MGERPEDNEDNPDVTLTRRTSLMTFAALSVLLLAVEAWVATFAETNRQPGIMAIAIAADLIVGVPLLYYMLLVRRGFLPPVSIVAVFALTLIAVRVVLPSSQQSLPGFTEFLILAIELSLAVLVLFKLRHIVRDVRIAKQERLYFVDALRAGLRMSLRSDLVTGLLVAEVSMFYFAFAGWFMRFETSNHDASVYSYHQKSSLRVFLGPLVVLALIETGLLHLVIGIWSQAGAWAFTAINVYTLLWLVGHFQATRLQPVIVNDEYIYWRTGLIWRGQTALSNIAEIRKPAASDLEAPGFVNVSLEGKPDVIVVLKETELLESLFGRKKEAGVIGIKLDDPGVFQMDVRNRLEGRPAP